MKRVLFVCGSLEPGHDGVGDYTRELAGAIRKTGLEVKIIAIRDRNCLNIKLENQAARGISVDVVRLSKSLSLSERRKEYQQLVVSYNPDWISLQYVPYAFSSKGIPFGLARFLKIDSDSLKWHFMFHESYINGNLGFKDQLIKKSQISIIRSLQKVLDPQVINTSTPQYQNYLKAIGVDSKILGLFGNIPISQTAHKAVADDVFRGVYFGASPAVENIQAFVNPFRDYLNHTNGKLEIVLCGESGEKGKRFASLLRSSVDSDRFTVLENGRMSSEALSELFLSVDFGIARIPPELLGKSGSAIALLEHGLPLWVPLAQSKDQLVSSFDFLIGHCFIDLIEIKSNNRKFGQVSRLDEISSKLKNQLMDQE